MGWETRSRCAPSGRTGRDKAQATEQGAGTYDLPSVLSQAPGTGGAQGRSPLSGKGRCPPSKSDLLRSPSHALLGCLPSLAPHTHPKTRRSQARPPQLHTELRPSPQDKRLSQSKRIQPLNNRI